jgi:hypothetical protein
MKAAPMQTRGVTQMDVPTSLHEKLSHNGGAKSHPARQGILGSDELRKIDA